MALLEIRCKARAPLPFLDPRGDSAISFFTAKAAPSSSLGDSLAITFVCIQCGESLSVKDEVAGKKGKCPQCGVLVPHQPGASAVRTAVGKTLPPKAQSNGGNSLFGPAIQISLRGQ
jgi:predicted RNA-binding Zn-ribbon protein involved in translation (DUF1610 family)